jgi:succinyl-diaminopimelate desuccinylase
VNRSTNHPLAAQRNKRSSHSDTAFEYLERPSFPTREAKIDGFIIALTSIRRRGTIRAAMNTAASIVDLLQQLTRTSSRAGVDSYEPIAKLTANWLRDRNVVCESLTADGKTVGLCAVVAGTGGPEKDSAVYMLNATLDTAPFGDESRWTEAPTSGCIRDGWIYGRGTADSKAGASLICHLTAELAATASQWRGKAVLLLDLDEHTGAFTGVRQYFSSTSNRPKPNGVFIGYPGNERIVIGSRGFLRAVLTIHGVAAHSGSASETGINAVVRAAVLVEQLSKLDLGHALDPNGQFPLPPRITVTAIEGGTGFSMIPDTCRLSVDMRLTPRFSDQDAKAQLQNVIGELDRAETRCPKATIEWSETWPAYRVAETNPMVNTLQQAAELEFNKKIPLAVVGPSNIGNYLRTLDIPVISGFGVTYRAIHAVNECVELASLEPVYRSYRNTLTALLAPH